MDYVRLDPRRHRKPKSLRVGWRAMRVYEALLDVSAIYDLGGYIPPEYLEPRFLTREVNLEPEDWGYEPFAGEAALYEAVTAALGRLSDAGLLVKNDTSSGGFSIRGWEEFYGARSGSKFYASGSTQKMRVNKVKELYVGTENETQLSDFSPTPHNTTPHNKEVERFGPSDLAALWNAWAASRKLPQVTKLAGKRLVLAQARCREGDASHWQGVLDRIAACPGLLGKNDRNWTVSFDWLLEPMSSAKVLEGKYDRWGKGAAAANVVTAESAVELYGPGGA